ncbi:hypothetical protein M493_12265 [Geobacillus genomosp. 3]|uniref:Uncharacterized protein n=1 Tax=Geobacillus genomosp. 3 TaxID=1921421 RepID=S5ZEI6_GEOG3|nr:hypothetical protein M493_12265 [Geobacillus genomosp. 3]
MHRFIRILLRPLHLRSFPHLCLFILNFLIFFVFYIDYSICFLYYYIRTLIYSILPLYKIVFVLIFHKILL